MSIGAKVKEHWKKVELKPSNQSIYIAGLTFAVVVFFKVIPYFADHSVTKVFIREADRKSQDGEKAKLPENLSAGGVSSSSSVSRIARSLEYGKSSTTGAPRSRVLERPLFDGKSVTLQVRLSNALDSSSGDSTVEGKIIGILDSEQPGTVDSSIVMNGTIRGSATPNFDSKRYNAQFSEIVNTEGKGIPVSAVAYNPGDSSLGIPSEYSSGLASRLAGSAINRVIVAADAVAESRILDDGSTSAVDRELSRVAQQGGSETANGLGDEASKGLRETKAILKVPAGTIVYVKMQVTRGAGGIR